ncbi:MAG: hypothetical protein AAGD22_11180 [Verrucomicrobiota bacterium]
MKKVLIVFGSVAAAIALLGVLFYIGARGVSVRPMFEDEKELLLPLSCFNPEYASQFSFEKCESFLAKTNIDGSLELEYRYDSDRDPNSPFLFYTSEAEINRSIKDAETSFSMSIAAYKTGVALVKGRTIAPLTDFFTLGERNYAARIEDDGIQVGNIVVTRQGKIVHSLLVIGMTFDSRDEIEALMSPVVLASKARN